MSVFPSFKDWLSVGVLGVTLLAAVGAWLSGFASAGELEALSKKHDKDILRIETKIDTLETSRKRSELMNGITSYTDKVHELQIKPNKSQYDKDMLKYYADRKDDLRLQLENF